MINKKWTLVLAAGLLSGCASMNKSECVNADWRTIGFEDGASGKAETAISSYRQDCADHGVAPDLNAYRLGHREGAERFCTSRNGFVVGKRGTNYQDSCPATLEADFLRGYRDGKVLYDLQRELNQANAVVDKQQRLLSRLEKDIVVKTELLVEDGLVKEERIQLLNDIEALKLQLLDIADQLPSLQRDVRRAEQHYHQAQLNFAHYQ
ncbi:DUF2799 domain-containing protein [Rheinheimera gaetbuli]